MVSSSHGGNRTIYRGGGSVRKGEGEASREVIRTKDRPSREVKGTETLNHHPLVTEERKETERGAVNGSVSFFGEEYRGGRGKGMNIHNRINSSRKK